MKQKTAFVVRRILTSIFLATGMLSIANIENSIFEKDQNESLARARIQMVKSRFHERLSEVEKSATKNAKKVAIENSTVTEFREALAQDEFGEFVPFAHLSTLDPLLNLVRKGVKRFERTTFRSPEYQGESGYDLVHYEVEHPNGARSSILAYLDRPLLTAQRNVGEPDSRVPVVMIMNENGAMSEYALYRAGHLVEQSQIPLADVSRLVAQRISQSLPFMSVSR